MDAGDHRTGKQPFRKLLIRNPLLARFLSRCLVFAVSEDGQLGSDLKANPSLANPMEPLLSEEARHFAAT